MNVAALCLAAAASVGLAALWLGLEWWRALDVVLPGPRPAASWALPAVLGAAALGALLAARPAFRTPAALRRLLALAAGATLFAADPLPPHTPDPGAGPLFALASELAAVAPMALAAACLAAALVGLVAARARARMPEPRALGGVLAATCGGVAAGALSYVDVLASGASATGAAATLLIGAALLCHLIPARAPPSETLPVSADPMGLAESAIEAPRIPATRRVREPRVAVVSPWLAGFVLALGVPALVTLLDQLHGAALTTRTELLLGVAIGGVLAGPMSVVTARRVVGLRGISMLLLALALMLSHWLPAGVLESLGGRATAIVLGLPVGLCATALIVCSARPERARGVAHAAPFALTGVGACAGVLWPSLRDLVGLAVGAESVNVAVSASGATLRGTALLCAVLSVPASFAAAASGRGVADGVRRWTASGLGVATIGVLMLGTSVDTPWRLTPDDRRLQRIEADPRGVVTVVETADGGVRLGLDRRTLLPGAPGALLGQRMARLSAALAPTAREALVLGLGDGQVVAELSALLPGTVTCVERVGALVDLAGDLPWAADAASEPPVLVHDEPLAALLARRGTCALIVVAPEEPGRPGAGARLSREHYRVLRDALLPDGVAVQWLPLHCMPWPAFASATQAFLEAFPDTRLYVASLLADVPLVALVGGAAGGSAGGLPGAQALDEVLARRPSAAGLSGAPDVFDLHLADGWTLLTRLRDAPVSSLARPWAELLSMRRAGDAAALSRINLRLLADLALPLDTASMRVRLLDEQADRQLGVELVARSAAAVALLAARATALELQSAAPGALSAEERGALEEAWHGLLLRAWASAPGHLDTREALLERALALTRADRWELAATLLDQALTVLPEGALLGVQCGVLLKLGQVDASVDAGSRAVALAAADRTALLNYGSALLFAHRDTEALEVLSRARDVFRPRALPPLQIAALGLLERDPESTVLARALVERLPPSEPWSGELQRLLDVAQRAGG